MITLFSDSIIIEQYYYFSLGSMCQGLSPGAYTDLEFVKSNANLGIKLIVQDLKQNTHFNLFILKLSCVCVSCEC